MPYPHPLLMALFLGLGLVACSLEKPPPAENAAEIPAAADSGIVYVVLPASYSRHLTNGGELLFASNGLPEDLPVYKTREEAEHALLALESAAERSRHLWTVYSLKAAWDKDVITLESGEHRLKEPARILGVVERAS